MSRAILTLPLMPVDGNNYGKFVTPIICETLKEIYGAKYYHCINLLDSFNNREVLLDNYVKSLEENNINYDEIWMDKNNVEQLLKNINELIKKDYIKEIESEVYKCDCGIVEIEQSKIKTCNPNNLKFRYKDDEIYCKHCGSKCKCYKEKILVFYPKNIKRDSIQCLPRFINKDTQTYENIIINSYTTISRSRNTGVELEFNGRKYKIDIDFLWSTYLANFEEDEKIVVSGNRMLYQLFLVGVLEKCLNKDSNTILLATPYLTNAKDLINDPDFIEGEKFRKLSILFNLKWANKERNYDSTILRYLKSLNTEKRINLYNIIRENRCDFDDFYDDIDITLKRQMNMQDCVKKLKLERGVRI